MTEENGHPHMHGLGSTKQPDSCKLREPFDNRHTSGLRVPALDHAVQVLRQVFCHQFGDTLSQSGVLYRRSRQGGEVVGQSFGPGVAVAR